jgi:hypothetical protein
MCEDPWRTTGDTAMKFCQSHWDALKAAIESRGLGHLVAANGRDAHARVVADLTGKSDVSDFDPLMSAHWMIVSRATQVLGIGIMCAKEDGGEYCPVCELVTATPPPPAGHQYPTNELYFIDGPADAMLADCREMGIDKPAPSVSREPST